MLSPALAPLAPKRKGGHCAGWRPPGALGRHGLRHGHLVRYPTLISPPPREPARGGRAGGSAVSYASRGLAPREGLEPCVDEDGPCWPPTQATPQAGKSGDPRSQNADSGARGARTGGVLLQWTQVAKPLNG